MSQEPVATSVDDGDELPPEATKRPSRKRLFISLGVGIVVMVGLGFLLLPKIDSYETAIYSLQHMSWWWIAALIVACLLNIMLYPFTVLVSVPGLKYWHGFIERQVGFLISCAIPGGGVFAVGAQYRILNFYKVPPARSVAAVSADAVWVYLLTLTMPSVALTAVVLEGRNTVGYETLALLGLLVVIISIIVIIVVLRSDAGAAAVGRLAQRLLGPVFRRFHKPVPEMEKSLMAFRNQAYDLVRTRWKAITVANTVAQLTPLLVLLCALGGLDMWPGKELSFFEIFAAFSIALLLVSIPISPGGLGTVDAALVALLTAFGANAGEAVAADLLWRLVWFLPQILVGAGSMLAFFIAQKRALSRQRLALGAG